MKTVNTINYVILIYKKRIVMLTVKRSFEDLAISAYFVALIFQFSYTC